MSSSINSSKASPVILNNAPIVLNQGNTIIITGTSLQTLDADNTPAQLTYTLTSLPSHGTLRLNGTALTINNQFTQDDINNSRLTYEQNGSRATTDSFNFTVSDIILQTTTRISVAQDGIEGNGTSDSASISGNGRYVVFASNASNLVSGDTDDTRDIFLRDLVNGTTSQISLDSENYWYSGYRGFHSPSVSGDGRYVAFESDSDSDIVVQDLVNGTTTRLVSYQDHYRSTFYYSPRISGDGRYVTFYEYAVSFYMPFSWEVVVYDLVNHTTTLVSVPIEENLGRYREARFPSISGDGHYVAFESDASNLVSGDTNNAIDIFVRDLINNTTTRTSVDMNGIEGNGASYSPSISGDGRYVAFESDASNLVSGDTNNAMDIFVRDLINNTTTRISVDINGIEGNGASYSPSISGDGRYVTFESDASNLVSGDTNNARDIFVRDLINNTTTRISVDINGIEGNGASYSPSISGDGRYVTFESDASNLVSGDTNNARDIFVRDLGVGSSLSSSSSLVINLSPAVHRFVDLLTGMHFYTCDPTERESIHQSLPNFQEEGSAFLASQSQDNSDLLPVYRFLNFLTGDHFYTINEEEKNSVLNNFVAYQMEGIAFYAYGVNFNKGTNVYRFVNEITGEHFYTADLAERDFIINNLLDFNLEGVAFKAFIL